MQITFKLQDLNFSDDINSLLCQIDSYLSSETKKKLDNDRFGGKVCVNSDNAKLLVKYKKILLDKVSNNPCLCEFLIDDIISRIKQLLNSY